MALKILINLHYEMVRLRAKLTVLTPSLTFCVAYLCQTLMGPAKVHSKYVAHDGKCPGSWREAGRFTVPNLICNNDKYCSEEQQALGIPIKNRSKHKRD